MTTIICIGVVTALAGFMIVLKTRKRQPKKIQKWEKAAIMKQLLALSEVESSIPAIAPSRPRKPGAIRGTRPTDIPRQATTRVSQPATYHQGRC